MVMTPKSDMLATRFEAKVREAASVLERLSDADWKKTTTAEKWTVGVTAHHLALAFEAVSRIATALASGQPRGQQFTRAMLDDLNARHAEEHAACTKSETLPLFQKNATGAASVVRGLRDAELARNGIVFDDAPPMTAEQLITLGLIQHIDEHMRSIRETVGAAGTS
jgi:Mycothiol maleylpyruvate isomerase N-terminal domain